MNHMDLYRKYNIGNLCILNLLIAVKATLQSVQKTLLLLRNVVFRYDVITLCLHSIMYFLNMI